MSRVALSRAQKRAEVRAAAQAECQARGWPWRELARVTGGLFSCGVWTNANMIDDNPWFVFSCDGRSCKRGGQVASYGRNASFATTPKAANEDVSREAHRGLRRDLSPPGIDSGQRWVLIRVVTKALEGDRRDKYSADPVHPGWRRGRARRVGRQAGREPEARARG